MSDNKKLPTHPTYAQAYGEDAARIVETVADKLEKLATRLRDEGASMARGDGKASSRAADVVSDFTNGTGNLGTYLWSIVHNAAMADREFDKAQRQPEKG